MDVLERIKAEHDQTVRARERALAELAKVEARIAELESAIRVIERHMPSELHKPTRGGKVLENLDALPARGAKKALIRELLQHEIGMTVADIHNRIRDKFGVDVSPNTISVTLPRLRDEGYARLDGRHWFRSDPAETAGSPTTDAPAASHSTTGGHHGPPKLDEH